MKNKQDYWIDQYRQKGALWIHDGNPKSPHALLSSGNHSNGFFNSELVLEDPFLLDQACLELTTMLRKRGLVINDVDRVVGPAMGAITIAHEMAYHISTEINRPCLRAYTEKEGEGETQTMVFKRTSIRSGERILLCEDVLTTGRSVELVANAVIKAGGVCHPFMPVLVNRSGNVTINCVQIVALIDRPMPIWKPDTCPLCRQGSEAIRPKGKENWRRLNMKY